LDAFYERDGDAFVPSELTRGPWDPAAQHAGPPSALLGRAVERDGWLVGRITIELLRPVPLRPLTVASELIRPGRNVELLAATLNAAGSDPRPIARAQAWRLKIDDGVDALPDEPPPPGPESGGERSFFPTGQSVGYHTAMDYSFLAGAFTEPGPASVWMRMRQPLVAGESTSPLQRVLVAADSGNGVSAALDYRDNLFINTELTVHLVREPAGEWVHLDAVTRVGPNGVGLSETVLHDEHGRLGRAAQTLLIRRRE
jgi:acyl-Coa thioesterase superfamily protein/acyl-CoA thioesterase superfamily protein